MRLPWVAPGQRIELDRTFFLPDGYRIKVSVKSDNTYDTSVNIAGYLFDAKCASEVIAPVKVAVGTDTGELDVSNGRVKVDDLYHADINVAIDNLDTQDEYTVTWFKNGARVTADVATPFKLTVIDRSDNSTVLNNVDLAELATDTGILWKNEGTDRLEPGNAYVVIVSATIDGATRTFSKLVSRDAEA